MEKKVLLAPFYLIAAACIGLGDTLYLSYYEHLGLTPTCALHGCEQVLTSVYAKFNGVPLAYIGLVFYVYMLALALLLAYDPHSKGLRLGVLLYTAAGLLLSIGFESVQILIIGAICMYCAISAITTLLLCALAVWHFFSTRAASAT